MAAFPLKYVAPNALTCASLTLGLVSVFHSLEATPQSFESAAWFVMVCVLLDKADGSVARLLNASSSFGVQLDSFSDFVTFGIAPAFLIYQLLTPVFAADAGLTWVLRVAVIVFVLASCLRLAKFNVLTEKVGTSYFLGLPTTMAGAFTVTWFLTVRKYQLPEVLIHVYPAIFALLSSLMVSNFKLPKVRLTRAQPWRLIQVFLIVSVYVCGVLWIFPEFLLALGFSYVTVGFIYGSLRLRDPADTTAPDPKSAAG